MSAVIPVLRFAPSPNGELHLGHAYSALLNHDLAKAWGGKLHLRIEDVDLTRCTPEFEARIYRDLEWLGIEWETPVRRQSEHFEVYNEALERLKAMGLVYPAFMSRGEIRAHIVEHEASGAVWPRDPDGAPVYPEVDKELSEGERKACIAEGRPYSWRIDMERALSEDVLTHAPAGASPLDRSTTPSPSRAEVLATPPPLREGGDGSQAGRPSPPPGTGGGVAREARRGGGGSNNERYVLNWRELEPASGSITETAANPLTWGDVILARSDIPTSYHLSVVIDDALQNISHIVRGSDLFHATSVHRLLQNLLGLPEPVYHHHRLILGADQRKLSKSEKSTGLRVLREAGVTPQQIREMVGL